MFVYVSSGMNFLTSKIPSIRRTTIKTGTPALAARGVNNVSTDVAKMPIPNICETKN